MVTKTIQKKNKVQGSFLIASYKLLLFLWSYTNYWNQFFFFSKMCGSGSGLALHIEIKNEKCQSLCKEKVQTEKLNKNINQ